METIKLTNKQRFQLLKMCKTLFSELGSVQLGVKEKHGWSQDYLIFGIEKPDDQTFVIHWFEFCMRYITPKLDGLYFKKVMYPLDPYHHSNKGKELKYPENWQKLWRKRPYEQWNHNCNGRDYKKPPVDYLYEEFNNLKSLI